MLDFYYSAQQEKITRSIIPMNRFKVTNVRINKKWQVYTECREAGAEKPVWGDAVFLGTAMLEDIEIVVGADPCELRLKPIKVQRSNTYGCDGYCNLCCLDCHQTKTVEIN